MATSRPSFGVVRLVDLAHATRADLAEDFEVPEPGPGGERHFRSSSIPRSSQRWSERGTLPLR